MTRNDLTLDVYRRTQVSYAQCEQVVAALFEALSDALSRGDSIYVRRFATIKVVTRQARPAHNFADGTDIALPQRRAIKFVPSKALKTALNSSSNE